MAKRRTPAVAPARTVRRKAPARRARNSTRTLRQRLREAEDTLTAIREGHVDALVMRLPDGEQIYTLRSADQPYRLMVEQMHEGALTLSAGGVILYCNTRFAELLGWSSVAITGQAIEDFISAGDRDKLQALLHAPRFRDEVRLLARGGRSIPAQLSATALVIDDIRTAAVVVSDLTPERTEKALRESNRLKDEFLATLSHELRTPLNVILGWTRMLLSGHLEAAARQRALELVDRNAHAQAQIVSDLVDMSRITTGKMRLDLQPMPALPALVTAADSVRPAAEAKGVSLETAWRVGNAVVVADATRFQQILWNLLSNALKFTPAGGRIRVGAARAGASLRIEVSDSGIGIDPSFVPQVFDRFRQADTGTTRSFGGLGIGLAIVQDLVRLHGGTIEAQSAGTGEGATFVVTLPVAGEAPASRPSGRDGQVEAGGDGGLDGHLVLLVEDHDDSRELTTRILERAGASVRACASAADAFAALADHRFSAIVADIGMPGEDGLTLIRRIRLHRSSVVRGVPAVALTAYSTAGDRDQALAAGFQRYLTKPVDPVALVEALREILGGRAVRSRRRPVARR
jgi:PAS domain S-box-containing protein